ncbi:hypothetical protein [Thiocystis violacea]|uniref:hypothetical protein n=1 Tax=Thiocystis violacea TaxID=13725 RepID=UPI001903BFB0|nr:hypothetical protein [Thiocystis violacea]MBK1720341.1 hypothetical protein [Thiocystis violacea]
MRKLALAPIVLLIASGHLSASENPASAAAPPTAAPVVATVPAAPATPAPVPTTVPSLSGKWLSSLIDEVFLEQSGDKITGTYEYMDDDDVTQSGKIEAVLKDQVIQGKWWERPKVGSGEEMRGDLEWKVVDDGKSLMGWYRDEGDEEKTDWNLTR